MRNFLVFESQKLWFNIPGRENTMRNKSLIHTKDVKTQEGTPLHLEYYLLNDSVLGGCAECYGVEILAQTGEAQCYAGIPRITMRGTSIFTLIDQLAYFAVTPDSLNDVIQVWLYKEVDKASLFCYNHNRKWAEAQDARPPDEERSFCHEVPVLRLSGE